MVATYTVFGRQVGAHVLSLATIGTLIGGITLAKGGKTENKNEPPITASSKDEEQFIQDFIKNIQAEEKKNEKAPAH
ncbi:hypothetical protein KEM55_004649 [Ascosphaera atra]|nr:hypothetical protein KEM55_004649 [Ascosphaera atra]